jgi:hypothetical protein
MQQPTINKQLYSWGTTKKPSASLSVEALPADYNSTANANYKELRNSNIIEPYPIHNGVMPVNTETGYFQPGANLSVQSLPPMDYNVEYKQLRESNIIMPAPVVIPNFYIRALNAGNTEPDRSTLDKETITNYVDMMAIILEYKKERRSPDFDKWMSINSTYKKLVLLEKQRTLTENEIKLKQELEQNILNELDQIKVDDPVAVPTDPVAADAISADPPPATPVDRSDAKLRATGAALLVLIATGATILPSQLTALVQSISLPNIGVLNSMLSLPINSGMSATISALSSLAPSSMQILAIMLTSGSAYMMYKRGRPVVLDQNNFDIDRQNQFFPDPGGLQNQMTSVVADPSYANGWAIMPSGPQDDNVFQQYPIFSEQEEEKEYPDIPFSSVIPLFPLSSVGVLGENPITPIQVVNPQLQQSQLYMRGEQPGMPFRDPPLAPYDEEIEEENDAKERFINVYFDAQLKPRGGNSFYTNKKTLEKILVDISDYKKNDAKRFSRQQLVKALRRSSDTNNPKVMRFYKSILNGTVNSRYA